MTYFAGKEETKKDLESHMNQQNTRKLKAMQAHTFFQEAYQAMVLGTMKCLADNCLVLNREEEELQ